jgi:molecular chaperone GrpE (heat shock protein)
MSDRTEILRQHMKLVDIASFQALSEQTGLSRRAIDTLRKGNASTLKYTELAQLARILQLELQELIAKFINPIDSSDKNASTISTISTFHQEYQRLQQKLENQQQELRSQFERETIQQLESLLLQLPSAAYAAQNNPNMLAKNILPLLKPLDVLLQKWGITVIGFVGEEIAYDPQKHQLIEGNDEVEIGNPAIVRYIGYTKGEILLYRARVSAKPH